MNAGAAVFFAAALAAAAATPGPTITAVVARVLAHGRSGALRFCTGLLLAELLWLLCAIVGVGSLAARHPGIFEAIRYAGLAWLLRLAWKLWHAPPMTSHAGAGSESRALLAGAGIALGNPKTMLFYVALLPGIVGLDALSARNTLILAALVATVVGAVLALYVLLAERVRCRFHSAVALRRIGRGSALLMVAAAAAIAIH
ncbi:LysE family translocator [Dokdonella sp.]|uniref:LysE family translocator n=1 Tax=Dokdonella sp. TaxID=2291710 RepID=UPI002F3FAAE9